MTDQSWPRALHEVRGPIPRERIDGAAQGMGSWGEETRALVAQGLVQPDMMTGLTLFLLSGQPKNPNRKQKIPGGGGGVAGGVWVREQFTIHRPLGVQDPFVCTGESLGRYVAKGRRYGINRCETRSADGDLVASNLTTGLLAYKVDEALSEVAEGLGVDDVEAPQIDRAAAGQNPCMAALEALSPGEVLGGDAVTVSLEMMAARDTDKPSNPIHSDPELAKKAGLKKPIAGGSHVLAFALEPILAVAGRDALLHGACFDVRWKAPVFAGTTIYPLARVRDRDEDKLTIDLEAKLDGDVTAMVGEVVVPLV